MDILPATGLCLLLRFLEPLLTKPPSRPQPHSLCAWAITASQIPAWKSHPPGFIGSTKSVSQLL